MGKKLKAMAVGLALVTGSLFGATAVATPAHAATDLGGVSVWNACVYQHGTPSYVVLVSSNVLGWRCQYHGGAVSTYEGVNLTQECKRVHGGSAYAAYLDYNNPYSWRCWRP